MNLEKFISSNLKNCWITEEDNNLNIYVRRGIRRHQGESLKSLDIASIEAIQKGKGSLEKFMKRLLVHHEFPLKEFDAIFIENILNRRLVSFFTRYKFEKYDSISPDICLIYILLYKK